MIDGEVIDVREGTVVRVAPEGARAWRNNGDQDLHYIVIQARAGTVEQGTITDGTPVAGAVNWTSEART